MTGSTPLNDENPPSPPFSKGGLGGFEIYSLTNTNELIFFTPHPPLPLKGEGLPCGVNSTTPQGKGGGDDTLLLRLY